MKQFLESSQNQDVHSHANTDEVIGKGYAKSLLAKWKSMESMEGKEGSPTRRLSKEGSPGSVDVLNGDQLIQHGNARNLLNKWNNIDSNSEQTRRAPRQITPPPSEELKRNKHMFDSPREQHLNKTVDTDAELNLIRSGNAKNALARLVLPFFFIILDFDSSRKIYVYNDEMFFHIFQDSNSLLMSHQLMLNELLLHQEII